MHMLDTRLASDFNVAHFRVSSPASNELIGQPRSKN